jgi:hypothetical protein
MTLVPDYDEFNIYTTVDDVENYIESLFEKGFQKKDEIYSMCVSHFGEDLKNIIDILFIDED